jgi:hypothetical protein
MDERGKKLAQQMLTRQKGNVESVAAAPVAGGWVVGWMDDRSGNARPYLALLGDRLQRKLPDQRIGTDGGPPSTGFAVAQVGDEVWHVRTQASADAPGALTLARLAAKTLKPVSEQVLAPAGVSYRTPSLVQGASRPTILAIREGGDGSKLVLFSPEPGNAQLSPLVLGFSHDVVSYSAACEASRCRVIANTESDQAQFVEALTFSEAAAISSAEVARLVATSSLEIAPVLRRNDAWLYDLSTRGQPRISRLKLDW